MPPRQPQTPPAWASVRECLPTPDARSDRGGRRSYDLGVRRVVSFEPIFVVSDVARAVAHCEKLGFSTSHHDEGYACAHRDELTIHLAGPGVDLGRVGRGSTTCTSMTQMRSPRSGRAPA